MPLWQKRVIILVFILQLPFLKCALKFLLTGGKKNASSLFRKHYQQPGLRSPQTLPLDLPLKTSVLIIIVFLNSHLQKLLVSVTNDDK